MGDCVLTFVPVNRIADPDYTGVDLEVAPAPERVRASWRVFGIQRSPLVLRQPLLQERQPSDLLERAAVPGQCRLAQDGSRDCQGDGVPPQPRCPARRSQGT